VDCECTVGHRDHTEFVEAVHALSSSSSRESFGSMRIGMRRHGRGSNFERDCKGDGVRAVVNTSPPSEPLCMVVCSMFAESVLGVIKER
jgi:hypothetical protein